MPSFFSASILPLLPPSDPRFDPPAAISEIKATASLLGSGETPLRRHFLPKKPPPPPPRSLPPQQAIRWPRFPSTDSLWLGYVSLTSFPARPPPPLDQVLRPVRQVSQVPSQIPEENDIFCTEAFTTAKRAISPLAGTFLSFITPRSPFRMPGPTS